MSIDVIKSKLLSYQCNTVDEQLNALKEIAQEIALSALSRAGFFQIAAFQGGTCLRILYGLERFSEDLDFILFRPNKNFTWENYIQSMREEFSAYGFTLEVKSRKSNRVVQNTFLKVDSTGGILILKDMRTHKPQMRIKLEIDTHPPLGSKFELKYLDFPLPYSVQTQDLPSLFAGKCHALLCRPYVKGRDWYDFNWYIAKKTSINFEFFAAAIIQIGPWQGKKIAVTSKWLITQLKKKITSMDWDDARDDVRRFLRAREAETLRLWSKDFFLSQVEKLSGYL